MIKLNFKIKEINTELNCHEIYTLFKDAKDTMVLDSSKEDSKYSNYSFIGINPFMKFKSFGNKVDIEDYIMEAKEEIHGNPFDILEKLVSEFSFTNDLEIPLVSGALGYFSYDAGRTLEKLPTTAIDDVKLPDMYFLFYDNIIIFDLRKKKTYITGLGIIKDSEESISDLEKLVLSLEKPMFNLVFREEEKTFNSNFTRKTYIEGVKRVKDYILDGHVYIANFTQRMWCSCEQEGYDIYSKLREINKAPFSCYLNLDDFQVISSSPERFLKVENRIVETRPIKGTRPRGVTLEEDEKNKLELINSEKDKAELLMVVDLERNDLSKVCKPHSVKVTELFQLEEYATVFHLVSTVVGKLQDDASSVKCIKECFPGGSITGTPKIRTMEIIEEIEGVRRGLYTGAIGYFDFRGGCDFNIVIRTIVKKGNKAYFGVGGGITIESEESMEYEESLDKAKALMKVL